MEAQACLLDMQEPMRFILVLRITFELQQEPMRFIFKRIKEMFPTQYKLSSNDSKKYFWQTSKNHNYSNALTMEAYIIYMLKYSIFWV